ncbi:MAG: ribosome maturation factor RimM [Gammaproteobacteria bacterium]|nr:ribosome maturation factor RimM [Gammaproteobacteria bacterium]
MPADDRRVLLGSISGVYGVRGWVKIRSATEPRERIIEYAPWQIGIGGSWREWRVEEGRRHGDGVIAKLAGVDDRDDAVALVGAEIAVPRSCLPPSGEDEYYWADLIGLRVMTLEGVALGTVERLLETGANDVLVVQNGRERLIPFLRERVVRSVDLEAGVLQVDWDPDF